MRCAVIGTGLAGLSIAFLLKKEGIDTTLFGAEEDVYVGAHYDIMQPYLLAEGKRIKFADSSMRAAKSLIREVEKYSGDKIILGDGAFVKNIALTNEYDDVYQLNGGWIIRSARTIFLKRYIESLKESLLGSVKFVCGDIKTLGELDYFNQIIITCGLAADELFGNLPLRFVNERNIVCSGVKTSICRSVFDDHKIVSVMNGSAHVSFQEDDKISDTDIEKFLVNYDLCPLRHHNYIKTYREGSYMPLVSRVDERTILFTGFGDMELMHHAFYGAHVVGMLKGMF